MCDEIFHFRFNYSLNLNFDLSLAQIQAQPSSNINTHDGFFLRMLFGFRQTEFTEEMDYGGDLKMSGVGTELRFQIGGCVSEILIQYGDVDGVNYYGEVLSMKPN